MNKAHRRLFALAASLALAGCPGLADERPDGGYDPNRGMAFDMQLRISDQRVLTIDPSTLPAVPGACKAPILGIVTHVVDGDTIRVSPLDGGANINLRMIGVDTPEVDHGPDSRPPGVCGREAKGFTEILRGHYVWLTYDEGCQDDFGRDLAYVWIGTGDSGRDGLRSDMWNRQLLRRGFATPLTIAPNDHHAETFESDRAAAEAAGVGLWADPPTCLPL